MQASSPCPWTVYHLQPLSVRIAKQATHPALDKQRLWDPYLNAARSAAEQHSLIAARLPQPLAVPAPPTMPRVLSTVPFDLPALPRLPPAIVLAGQDIASPAKPGVDLDNMWLMLPSPTGPSFDKV